MYDPVSEIASATQLLRDNAPFTVLSGAGISTDSGIPAYRNAQGQWVHAPPMQHHDFMADDSARKRYWARSLAGWLNLYHAQPNHAHHIITQLQQRGYVDTVITQNVDGLHQKAGSTAVINLHGYANDIICMACGGKSARFDLHHRYAQLNPQFNQPSNTLKPDGDAVLTAPTDDFKLIDCDHCGGILKPDVVYFGDNVPKARVEACYKAIDDSQGLLVVGSSLKVFSGFRFARYAHQQNKPVIILTQGITRADDLATVKLDATIADTLGQINELLND
ncbi:NAD-dependent SIR2 family protein deacetylase [Idiomarina fontislapidosi]|uniref:protein acetyllysine N-acetyltransferase n=1 Tax=Idiomarina fontislapidosi TaxID=263723 RepID=A0A432Y8Z9_9GAMM|nr:NAD-dependent protein deacetylase [Idiomarina fontislapidosi]PYE34620.1 NAD-dependent SIR2 family protein deacetylase [Idiomarina fontislapidosi]RUO57427.1 NAD-dependent protein deacetylase [Idiomarina fontislapidosi]|tara:strand:- start:2166 stop:2999 length:834 start_codon:yes stop_codon:yes gene_type:complete